VTTNCLLVCENDFLVAGVKALLAGQSELEINAIGIDSEAELTRTIQTYHPDVVILDEGLHVLTQAQVRELCRRIPALQLIVVNHLDNVMRVFQGSWFAESQVQELGQIITNHKLHS